MGRAALAADPGVVACARSHTHLGALAHVLGSALASTVRIGARGTSAPWVGASASCCPAGTWTSHGSDGVWSFR